MKVYLVYIGAMIRMTFKFFSEVTQARREKNEMATLLKGKKDTNLEFCILRNHS